VFLISVFTHMLPEDVSHYVSEIHRVLREGGRSLMTFFLLNSDSKESIRSKTSSMKFKYDHGVWSTTDNRKPESAVAYDELFIRNLCKSNHLFIREPIHFGSWCDRKSGFPSEFVSYQDMLVAWKSHD